MELPHIPTPTPEELLVWIPKAEFGWTGDAWRPLGLSFPVWGAWRSLGPMRFKAVFKGFDKKLKMPKEF